jgi:hypothetical protein
MAIEQTYEYAGEEPDLFDLLADPVIHAVMRRDGVTLTDLCAVIRTGRLRLATRDDPVEILPLPSGWPDWRCPEELNAVIYA